MKLENGGNDIILKGGSLDEGNFSILENSKMYEILSSKIYTDKIAAPIRELCCNAFDAHVEAGKENAPFYIHIPTAGEKFFEVRDFGNGMSPEDVKKLYTTYGWSSKSNSNKVIGCLGLGSKSPFAYTKTFYVNSVFNGKLTVFVCIMENKPKVTVFDTQDTDQPNGLTVKFDVKEEDVRTFQNRIENIIRWFPVKPKSNITLNYQKYPDFVDDVAKGTSESGNYGIQVLMGNVLYAVPQNYIELNEQPWPKIKDLMDWGDHYIIRANIGDVDISTSREFIELTEKSGKYILKVFEKARANLFTRASEAFKLGNKPIDRVLKALEVLDVYSDKFIGSRINTWINGEIRKIKDSIVNEATENIDIIEIERSKDRREKHLCNIDFMNGKHYFSNEVYYYSATQYCKHLWIMFPEGRSIKIPSDIRKYVKNNNCRAFLFNGTKLKDILEAQGITVHTPEEYREPDTEEDYEETERERTYVKREKTEFRGVYKLGGDYTYKNEITSHYQFAVTMKQLETIKADESVKHIIWLRREGSGGHVDLGSLRKIYEQNKGDVKKWIGTRDFMLTLGKSNFVVFTSLDCSKDKLFEFFGDKIVDGYKLLESLLSEKEGLYELINHLHMAGHLEAQYSCAARVKYYTDVFTEKNKHIIQMFNDLAPYRMEAFIKDPDAKATTLELFKYLIAKTHCTTYYDYSYADWSEYKLKGREDLNRAYKEIETLFPLVTLCYRSESKTADLQEYVDLKADKLRKHGRKANNNK